ncbi:hypothetical protein HU200_021259 [Digitaria exilis]|uniref:H(+)-exporting diphosphatase n=1 Tax=Digitaria exilis TaxID=1010633 RepID=A0A835KBR8_9POAL|nr:hypothetical protein HU200_021259 [Digitaria exilis]
MVGTESALVADVVVPACAAVGIAFALWQWFVVSKAKASPNVNVEDVGAHGEEEEGAGDGHDAVVRCAEIQSAISVGANSFLFTEYKYLAAFTATFAVVIFLLLGSVHLFSTGSQPCQHTTIGRTRTCKPALANAAFTAAAFLLGAATSAVSVHLAMRIATYANARTTLEARRGIAAAFAMAFRSGAAAGFLMASLVLLVLYLTVKAFSGVYYGDDGDREGLYGSVVGYGLGASSSAMFGRVAGGIYTKAVVVGGELVGKVERDVPEDDPRNPAVIAGMVGDNVGGIAGVGSDLLGSYAESTCAAMFAASISSSSGGDFPAPAAVARYPLLIGAAGLVVCLVTTLLATADVFCSFKAETVRSVARALTVLMTVAALAVSFVALPANFTVYDFGQVKQVKSWHMFFCVAIGLWAGLAIGISTDYFTSNTYSPVQDVADSCRTGAATNVIFGLALGYKSVMAPVLAVAVSLYVGFRLASIYGVAVAALGMLSTVATRLAIVAYGPISDNAAGIAKMAGMSRRIRQRTAAGNTNAAIGKGFTAGSAALVSLALLGAFVSRAGVTTGASVVNPKVSVGLLVGAALPYWLSAMTIKSGDIAALKVVEEVRRQFNTIPGLMEGSASAEPDYARCVRVATGASIREMVWPGALMLLAPLVAGTFFGVTTLAGLLVGAMVSGVQISISGSNSGGAWVNARNYIEAVESEHARSLGPKGSDLHKAAVIGDNIGDPLKDTSGPSINILIKLMAVESLVFAPFFAAHGGLVFK